MELNGQRKQERIEEGIEVALGRIEYEEKDWEAFGVREMSGEMENEQELEKIVRWLVTLERPAGMKEAEFRRFKKEATKYLVREGVLFRRGAGGTPPKKVICRNDERRSILIKLHDESGH